MNHHEVAIRDGYAWFVRESGECRNHLGYC